jgi:uncharacterized protein (DUF433 family)
VIIELCVLANLEYLASGMSVEEILGDFPGLTAEDIRACLAFAALNFTAGSGHVA